MSEKIAGKALYLELEPKVAREDDNKTVTQFLYIPEGFTDKGDYVPMSVHTRTVTTWSPRKQWRVSFSSQNNKDLFTSGSVIPQTLAQEASIKMVEKFEGMLKRQIGYEMVVRKTPIVVEVSTIDLEEVKDYKTPSALLRRIQKARVALTFPEKVL